VVREPTKTEPEGFAEIWRSAEQRRAEDMRGWLGQLFERRPLQAPKVDGAYSKGQPAFRSAKA
jgi:hypothetical protein